MKRRSWTEKTAPGMIEGLLLVALVGILACSGDKVAPGKPCVLPSDCPSPLTCSYGRCHVACLEARDCGAGQTCVASPEGKVCLLVDESSCGLEASCPTGLFCAQDLKCRAPCQGAGDCATSSQLCVSADKVCAEPVDLSGGQLVPPGGTAGAGGGRGGNGAGGAGGGGDKTGGAGGGADHAGGSPGSGGAAPGGNRASGGGGQAGAGASASGGIATGGTGLGGAGGAPACGSSEAIANDLASQATAYVVGTTVFGCTENASDHDYYRLTVPADPAGGTLRVSVTNVSPNLGVGLRLLAASDTAVLASRNIATQGQSNYLYAAVTPGASYLVDVSPYTMVQAPGSYALTVTYTALPDAYEPNDTRFDAKTITVGTPVSAYLMSGYPSATLATADDYYKVTLAAGQVTVTVDVFPTNLGALLALTDNLGAELANAHNLTLGGGAAVTKTVTAGDYYVKVSDYVGYNQQAGSGIDLPDNFTRPYRLTVTQP